MHAAIECATLVLSFGAGAAIMLGIDYIISKRSDEEVLRHRDDVIRFQQEGHP